MAAYCPPKGNSKILKDFCKDFLNKHEMSNKAALLLGGFNLNALDYDTTEVVKTSLMWFFKMDFYPLSKNLRELLEQAPLQLTIS